LKKIILIINLALIFLGCMTSKMSFDSEIWKDPESYRYRADDITERQKMLDSALELIKGKSKNEIIAILGNGEDSGYFIESGKDLIYILGPERSYLIIDREWLLLWFDQNNILERYEIYTD